MPKTVNLDYRVGKPSRLASQGVKPWLRDSRSRVMSGPRFLLVSHGWQASPAVRFPLVKNTNGKQGDFGPTTLVVKIKVCLLL